MFQKTILFIFIIFMLFEVNGQYNDRYSFENTEVKPDTVLKDFNQDQIEDTLIHYYYAISFSSGTIAEIRNGKTGESFGIDNYKNRGNFIRYTPVIGELFLDQNRPFKKAIFEVVFLPSKETTDPSYDWLMRNRDLVKQHPENHTFDKSLKYTIDWNAGKLQVPKNYRLLPNIDDTTIVTHFGYTHMIPHQFPNHQFKGNMNYELPKSMHSYDLGNILVGNNSIAIENDTAFAWLYISDPDITDSPGRLSAPNIRHTVLWGDYLLIMATGGAWTSPCYMIDLKHNILLRFTQEIQDIEIDLENHLILRPKEGDAMKYSTEEIHGKIESLD